MSFCEGDVYFPHIVSADRKQKSQFLFTRPPTIDDLLLAAKNVGLDCKMVLLETDGTRLRANLLVPIYIQKGHSFMVVNDVEDWKPTPTQTPQIKANDYSCIEFKLSQLRTEMLAEFLDIKREIYKMNADCARLGAVGNQLDNLNRGITQLLSETNKLLEVMEKKQVVNMEFMKMK